MRRQVVAINQSRDHGKADINCIPILTARTDPLIDKHEIGQRRYLVADFQGSLCKDVFVGKIAAQVAAYDDVLNYSKLGSESDSLQLLRYACTRAVAVIEEFAPQSKGEPLGQPPPQIARKTGPVTIPPQSQGVALMSIKKVDAKGRLGCRFPDPRQFPDMPRSRSTTATVALLCVLLEVGLFTVDALVKADFFCRLINVHDGDPIDHPEHDPCKYKCPNRG